MTINATQATAFYAELPKDMPSVAVPISKHQVFTKRQWPPLRDWKRNRGWPWPEDSWGLSS